MKFYLVLCFLFLVSFQYVSCADTYLSPESAEAAYNSADAVFIGEIEDIQVARRRFLVFPAEYTLTLSVKKAWKGISKESIAIRTGSHRGDCGSAFKKGESWLVFVYDKRILVKQLAKASDELEYLNTIYLKLPKPSGLYAIGTKNLYFVDASRPESFTPDPDDHREVAVRVWYPAIMQKDGKPVGLIENAPELASIHSSYSPLPPTVFDSLSSIETHSYRGADILESPELFPVLLFSHAYWAGMTQSTVLMEELASHGYIVVSIGHAYETSHFLREDGSIEAFDPRNEEFRLRGLERKNTLDIQNRYVLAFFDKHLKEMDSGLLNSPTPEYPEVEIWIREQEGN